MGEQQRLIPNRPSSELVAEAVEWVAKAIEEHKPVAIFSLYSGGNDSAVLLDVTRRHFPQVDAIIHVNTGTGVPETTEHVRKTLDGIRWRELTPPKPYEEVFIHRPIINGLPGPGMHHIAFNRLKERAIEQLVADTKRCRMDRVMFLTGIRADESRIRMGYGDSIIDRKGAQVWVNPLYRWTNEEMRDYRAEFGLAENPVSANLHISGECLCGAYARPDELEMIRFFYPTVAARIDEWERAGREKGLTYWKWGERRPDAIDGPARLCARCVGQMELFDSAVADGKVA